MWERGKGNGEGGRGGGREGMGWGKRMGKKERGGGGAGAELQCKISGFLDVQKNCIASHCTFSDVNMVIFKSYLDLHLSESDWCGFVVQFGLSDLSEKHSESAFVQNSCTLDMLPDSSACGLKKTWAKQDTET